MSTGAPRWAEGLVAALVRRRAVCIALVVAMAAAGAAFAHRWFRADNSARVWLLDDDPAVVAYEQFQAEFGNDEVALIVVAADGGAFAPDTLERVRRAARAIEALPDVRRVTSLGVSRFIDGDAIEIRADPLLPDGAVTTATAALVRERLRADPLLRGVLADDAGRVAVIVAQMPSFEELTGRRPAILGAIRAIARDELTGPGVSAHLGGIGVVYEGLNRAVLRDTTVFISLAYLVILVGLGVMFRRARWVVLGLAIIAIATLATAGLFGALDRKMNMVTSIVPTLILTVGILDLVHLLAAPADEPGAPRGRVLAGVIAPCVFNTITDVIGFLALATAPMAGVRDFGLLAAAGLAVLLVTTLIVAVPAIVAWGGHLQTASPTAGWMLTVVRALGGIVKRRRRAVLGAGAAVMVLSVAGIATVVVDTYTIEFLAADHPVRRDHERIESTLGPYLPLELTVRTGPDGVKDPTLLGELLALERAFERDPRVGRVTGLADVVARLNEVVMDGDPAERRIPATREAVAQELLLYESDANNQLDALVTPDFALTRITVRVRMTTARGIRALVHDLERAARDRLGDRAEVRAAGYLPLYVKIIGNITRAQVVSFSLAFALVGVVLMILLRSVRLGLVALVPNLLPTAATLGLMGALGIRLDVGTVLLASIAIGISVNDTSHMMFRFQRELRRTPGDSEGALDRTLDATGRAVFASSIVLVLGFAILGLASTNSIRHFGLLSAAAVVAALIADLIVTPALLLTVFRHTPSADGDASSPARSRTASSPS